MDRCPKASPEKLKRAQDAIVQMRPFAKKFNDILINVSSSLDNSDHPMMKSNKGNKILLIALSSNIVVLKFFALFTPLIIIIFPLAGMFLDSNENFTSLPAHPTYQRGVNNIQSQSNHFLKGFQRQPITMSHY